MAVVAQRQWLRKAAGQGLEAPEVRDPLLVSERIEPDARRPALIANTKDMLRERGRLDNVVKIRAEGGVAGRGSVGEAGDILGHSRRRAIGSAQPPEGLQRRRESVI